MASSHAGKDPLQTPALALGQPSLLSADRTVVITIQHRFTSFCESAQTCHLTKWLFNVRDTQCTRYIYEGDPREIGCAAASGPRVCSGLSDTDVKLMIEVSFAGLED